MNKTNELYKQLLDQIELEYSEKRKALEAIFPDINAEPEAKIGKAIPRTVKKFIKNEPIAVKLKRFIDKHGAKEFTVHDVRNHLIEDGLPKIKSHEISPSLMYLMRQKQLKLVKKADATSPNTYIRNSKAQ